MGMAANLAKYFHEHQFNVHRGVVRIECDESTNEGLAHPQGFTVVFGNDGYGKRQRAEGEGRPDGRYDNTGDPRTRRTVERVRAALAGLGTWQVDFDTSLDGYTWALVVEGDHAEALLSLVNTAWLDESAGGEQGPPC